MTDDELKEHISKIYQVIFYTDNESFAGESLEAVEAEIKRLKEMYRASMVERDGIISNQTTQLQEAREVINNMLCECYDEYDKRVRTCDRCYYLEKHPDPEQSND